MYSMIDFLFVCFQVVSSLLLQKVYDAVQLGPFCEAPGCKPKKLHAWSACTVPHCNQSCAAFGLMTAGAAGLLVLLVLQVLDPSGQVVDKQVKPGMASSSSAAGGVPETVLLVMLGGITFTEISALRFLASKPENNCR
jgi:hypothetical protein